MYNVFATFKNMSNLKECMKNLKIYPNMKGHMRLLSTRTPSEAKKEISSVLIKKSMEVSSNGLESVRFGSFIGFVIGAISAFIAVYFNTSILHLSTLSFMASLAIVFYGGAAGILLGFLAHTILSKYNWFKNKDEVVLVLQDLDDETKEIVLTNLEKYEANKIEIY